MATRKTASHLRAEIMFHEQNAREFFRKSDEIHQTALRGEPDSERFNTLQRLVGMQRLAISEIKKAIRLERILLERQRKTMK